MALFARYIGIDYSGAETADSSCRGLRVLMAEGCLMSPGSTRLGDYTGTEGFQTSSKRKNARDKSQIKS